MEDEKLPTGLEYPTLTLGDQTFPVRLTTWGALILERLGVSLAEPGGRPLEHSMKILAACLSTVDHTFTVEELAGLIPYEELPDAFRKLGVALSKARPQATEQSPSLQ